MSLRDYLIKLDRDADAMEVPRHKCWICLEKGKVNGVPCYNKFCLVTLRKELEEEENTLNK